MKEVGEREGKFYAINVPLKDGIDDTSFNRLFKTVGSFRKADFCLLFWLDGVECKTLLANLNFVDYFQGC